MSEITRQISALLPPWSVIDFSYSFQHYYARFVVVSNHVRYIVHAAEMALRTAPILQERFRTFINVAEGIEDEGYTFEDFSTWALEPLLPILCKDAQEIPRPTDRTLTLRDFFYGPIVEYTLQTEDGKLMLRSKEEEPESRFMFGDYPPEICGEWPVYWPLQIRLDLRDNLGSVPRHVYLPDGTRAFFKLVRLGEGLRLGCELMAHARLDEAQLSPAVVRIPRILGVVRSGCDLNPVFGLLFTHIGPGVTTLPQALEAGAPERLRYRWSEQIMRIVHCLHLSRLVWADARPENVLIDVNRVAWLGGYGGMAQPEWVPEHLVGTIDGDLVALKRIIDYMEGELPIDYS